MLVSLLTRRNAELEIADSLLEMIQTVMWLVIEIVSLTVDETKIARAGLTLDFKLWALQIVVVLLMLGQDPDAATVCTCGELLSALTQVAHRFFVWRFVRAGLVGTTERHGFKIGLGIAMHVDQFHRLVTLAAFGAAAAALGPGNEALATVGRVAIATLHRINNDHGADRATEILGFLFHFFAVRDHICYIKVSLQGQLGFIWRQLIAESSRELRL